VVPSLPYLAPWYRVSSGAGKVVLEHGQRIVSLEGRATERLVPALLPLLDGRRTVDEIVQVLGPAVRPAVEHALGALAEHGVLEAGPPLPRSLPRPAAGTAELLASLRPGTRPLAEIAAKVADCSVAVAGDGTAGAEAARLLRAGGVGVDLTDAVETAVDLTICAPARTEGWRLVEWNQQALDARAPWLQILAFDGRYASIGPLYLPGDTCCYECFRLRVRANLDGGAERPAFDGRPTGDAAAGDAAAGDAVAPVLDAIVGGLAALLVMGWLVQGDHYAPGAFYALELLPTLGLSVHHVYRVPRCPACSGLADAAPPLPWHKEVSLDIGR
jgi:bacteriocin biosynthesis cyclodehydratase domain-containing protein